MKKNPFFRKHALWLFPAIFALLITPFTPTLDLKISQLFYTPDPISGKGHFVSSSLTHFLFCYGELLGFFIGGLTCLLFFFSFFFKKLKPLRSGSLALAFTWVIGVGLICNAILKEFWGRPRPKQTENFGGTLPFHAYYQPELFPKEPMRSFPSGHVAVGFYYLSLILVGYRYKKSSLISLGIALTTISGGLLFYARIAQGAHYFSDALFAALIVWWVALFADWFVFESKWGKKIVNC